VVLGCFYLFISNVEGLILLKLTPCLQKNKKSTFDLSEVDSWVMNKGPYPDMWGIISETMFNKDRDVINQRG